MMRRALVVVAGLWAAGLCAAPLAGCGSAGSIVPPGPIVPTAQSYYLSLATRSPRASRPTRWATSAIPTAATPTSSTP